MAIKFNDNIQVNAGKPVDNKYLSSLNAPYTNVSEVISTIPVPERHVGLTVNVNNSEYWFANGVADVDLILKVSASGTTINDIQNVGLGVGVYSGTTDLGIVNLRSIVGSGATDVSLSGDTIIINSDAGIADLNDGILSFDYTGQTFQPYTAFPSGVTKTISAGTNGSFV